MLKANEAISVRAVFTRAGVPHSANLLAPRLGLRGIIEDAAREQVRCLDKARTQVSERYEVRHDMYRRVTHLLSRSNCA
jgi:hypothetical protein